METIQKNIKSKIDQVNPDKKEGKVATMLEEQTAKIPSDVFLWTALGSIAASITLKAIKKDNIALFVGMWVPTFLILGIYNKLVKQLGHDKTDK